MAKLAVKKGKRMRRKKRIRAKIAGTKERPRLTVFRSLKHIYASLVDDENARTLAAVSDVKISSRAKRGRRELATQVGQLIAEKAKELGIVKVVFDRGGYQYHGNVKALAEGAREAGLQF